ncbi:hypothetical protein [Streptomyces spinoverrucosus]|uniref:hypothetical protein n=1 Tax=Streptomyces spinoverrucosus TaxID=284043 RepID=UPI0035B34343
MSRWFVGSPGPLLGERAGQQHALAFTTGQFREVAPAVVATAVADEPLTWTATVRTVTDSDEGVRVLLDASILKEDGTPCVTGTVEVSVR